MGTLKEICEHVVGSQDYSLKKLNGKRLLYTRIIESKKFTNSGKIRHKVEFLGEGTGVANMKIHGDWEHVRLEVGGQQFDKIYKETRENTFQMLNDGCCLPYLEYHEIDFCIEGGDYELEYDIVSVDFNFKIQQEYFIKQIQYSGPEKKIDKINISFNHPVEKIIVYTDKPVSNVQFLLSPKYFFPFTQIDSTHWEFQFEPTLNFSVIDYRDPFIVCESTFEENTLHCIGITHHIVRFMYGMAGLAFSK
jgi:hypothetical protein